LFFAVLHTTVVHSNTHTHMYEQFLKMSIGLGLVFVGVVLVF